MADQAERRGGSDRTAHAVALQLRAMGCERYEVGIRDAETERMLLRTWSAAEVQEAVGWLRRMNARGNDIYIRPAGSVGLILVDDLTAGAVERLRDDGLAPAAVVETSPENFQAWVRVSRGPI